MQPGNSNVYMCNVAQRLNDTVCIGRSSSRSCMEEIINDTSSLFYSGYDTCLYVHTYIQTYIHIQYIGHYMHSYHRYAQHTCIHAYTHHILSQHTYIHSYICTHQHTINTSTHERIGIGITHYIHSAQAQALHTTYTVHWHRHYTLHTQYIGIGITHYIHSTLICWCDRTSSHNVHTAYIYIYVCVCVCGAISFN